MRKLEDEDNGGRDRVSEDGPGLAELLKSAAFEVAEDAAGVLDAGLES